MPIHFTSFGNVLFGLIWLNIDLWLIWAQIWTTIPFFVLRGPPTEGCMFTAAFRRFYDEDVSRRKKNNQNKKLSERKKKLYKFLVRDRQRTFTSVKSKLVLRSLKILLFSSAFVLYFFFCFIWLFWFSQYVRIANVYLLCSIAFNIILCWNCCTNAFAGRFFVFVLCPVCALVRLRTHTVAEEEEEKEKTQAPQPIFFFFFLSP